MYEKGMKYENIEFLDSSLLSENNNDPVDDLLTYDELTDQTSFFKKVILYLILCFTVLVNFLKFHFVVLSEKIRHCPMKTKNLKMNSKILKSQFENL